jgi:hypothetical protein
MVSINEIGVRGVGKKDLGGLRILIKQYLLFPPLNVVKRVRGWEGNYIKKLETRQKRVLSRFERNWRDP